MARSFLPALFAGTALVLSTQALAAPCPGPLPDASLQEVEVTTDGLVGLYLAPETDSAVPGIVVLGGSEGGTEIVRAMARPFAEQGYGVLALSYFGAEGLPDNLQEIPLDYFERAIDWLAAQPGIDADRLGIYGISKGGEAALLIASRDDRLTRVAAAVPSHVVWQGINMQDFTPRSSWSADGAPLDFVAYEMSNGFTSVYALYADALPKLSEDDLAIIPVEMINGPVMLISGKDDTLWPSTEMADMVVDRLEANGFAHPVRHLSYEDAGHGVSIPPQLGAVFGGPDSYVGGTDEGNAAARTAAWEALTCFFAGKDREQE